MGGKKEKVPRLFPSSHLHFTARSSLSEIYLHVSQHTKRSASSNMVRFNVGCSLERVASRLCLRAVRSGGVPMCQKQGGLPIPPQLSFACRLGFRRYDGCQMPVASCEDTEGEGACSCWYGFGSGSVALAEDWNSALDLRFWIIPHLAANSLSL